MVPPFPLVDIAICFRSWGAPPVHAAHRYQAYSRTCQVAIAAERALIWGHRVERGYRDKVNHDVLAYLTDEMNLRGLRLYASPLLADGKLYIMSIDNGGFVVDAASLKQLAHNTFADDKSRVNACPIAHEGCVLLRTDEYLYCIGKR
jgi:hypothetical protein